MTHAERCPRCTEEIEGLKAQLDQAKALLRRAIDWNECRMSLKPDIDAFLEEK